jgi:hypothetical protein
VVYALTVVAVAAAFLIAPVSYHRIVFRQGRKPQLVRVGSRLAALGLVCLLFAMLGAVFLAIDIAVGVPVAVGSSPASPPSTSSSGTGCRSCTAGTESLPQRCRRRFAVMGAMLAEVWISVRSG